MNFAFLFFLFSNILFAQNHKTMANTLYMKATVVNYLNLINFLWIISSLFAGAKLIIPLLNFVCYNTYAAIATYSL